MTLFVEHQEGLTSFSLPFSELSLMGLPLDMVDLPSFFGAMTLLVVSFDP